MLNFQDSLSNSFREEFFPFVNESILQEKLLTNGYQIGTVRKRKGVLSFKAKNSCEIVDTLLFCINLETKDITVVGIVSPHGSKIFLFRTIVFSSLREEVFAPFKNTLNKISFNKGMLNKLASFLREKNPVFWNQEENFFYENGNRTDPLLFMMLSKFKSLSYWSTTKQNSYMESSILDMLENFHSPKLPRLSSLSITQKRKLKKEVVRMIAYSFMKSIAFPGKRLFQIVNHGKAYLGLNIYPYLFDKVKYSETEFNAFFDEIKISLREELLNFLISDIQTLHMTRQGNNFVGGDKVKTLHRKIFDKKPNYHSLTEKYLEIKRAGLSLHVLMSYLEYHPEIQASFFENGNLILEDKSFEYIIWKDFDRVFGEPTPNNFAINMENYRGLTDLYQLREAYELSTRVVNETVPTEIPF